MRIKLDERGTWAKSLQWLVTDRINVSKAYKVWNKLMQALKRFSPKIDFTAPIKGAEVLSMPLKWTTHFYRVNFGFSYQ